MPEHIYAGSCPDINQPDSRDASCPACAEMLAGDRDELRRVALAVWEGIDIEWSDDPAWREAVADLGDLVVAAAENHNQEGGRDS